MSSFDLRGWDDFEKTLAETIEKKYPQEAKKFMRNQVNKLKKDVVNDTPEDEGKLKKSWKVSVKSKKGNIKADIKNTDQKAHLIENGHEIVDKNGKSHGYWEGKHMLETNVEKKKADFEREVNEFLNEALRELEL